MTKQLKKEIAKLKKQLRRQEKRQMIDDNWEEDFTEELQSEKEEKPLCSSSKLRCPRCSSQLEYVDINVRKIWLCSCGYRLVKK